MLAKKPKGAVQPKRSGGVASLLWMFVGAILTLMFGLFLYLWNPFDIGSETKTEDRTVEPINQGSNQSGDYEFYDLLPEQEITSIPDEALVQGDEGASGSVDLEPDVVVTTPELQERETNSTGGFGISEGTILNPMASQDGNAASGEQEIEIVEEEGTYDEPVSRNSQAPAALNSGSRANSAPAAAQSASIKAAPKPKLSYILQINSFSNAQEADKRRAQVLMAGVDAHVAKNTLANGQVIYQVVSSTMTNRQGVIAAQQKLQNNGIDSLIVEQRR